MATRRQTRLRELAGELGVSITTVSRALAGYSDVSETTRARVAEAARSRGYVPSRVGRMLVSGRTDFIGMVLPLRDGNMMDAFLGEFIAGLSETFVAHGRDLFIATATAGQSELDVLRHIVAGSRADAVILNRTRIDDSRVHYLTQHNFPFLTDMPTYPSFDTDGVAAFAEAARRLTALGHRRFGLITIDEPYAFAHLRRRGLEQGLAEAGLTLSRDLVESVPMSDRPAALAAAARMLAREDRPTVILGVTDAQALAVLEIAAQRSISVPEQLSVIGFDNVPIAAYANPALSTFDQHTRESAGIVGEMIIDLLEKGPAGVKSRLITPNFVARGSHGPVPR
jgi:LacI family transcriptional regulator, galactose operon repressor